MESFAELILKENDFVKKLELMYYLKKKENIFFDSSVILKAEIVRMFLNDVELDVDKNLVITAMLVCGCKKKKDATNKKQIETYAIEGAKYLETLGFDKRFCKICQEVNRYSRSFPREKESDILELIDVFGGLVLDRPERKGYAIDEAILLAEERILKGYNNRYIEKFKEFIQIEEGIKL